LVTRLITILHALVIALIINYTPHDHASRVARYASFYLAPPNGPASRLARSRASHVDEPDNVVKFHLVGHRNGVVPSRLDLPHKRRAVA